jgi:hypothetical protein
VPLRGTCCGLLPALSLTLAVPVLAPVAVGLNSMLILHVPLAARLDVQVVEDTVKSPVTAIEMPVSETACLLVRVSTLAALVVPTFCAGNVRPVAGVNVA